MLVTDNGILNNVHFLDKAPLVKSLIITQNFHLRTYIVSFINNMHNLVELNLTGTETPSSHVVAFGLTVAPPDNAFVGPLPATLVAPNLQIWFVPGDGGVVGAGRDVERSVFGSTILDGNCFSSLNWCAAARCRRNAHRSATPARRCRTRRRRATVAA